MLLFGGRGQLWVAVFALPLPLEWEPLHKAKAQAVSSL